MLKYLKTKGVIHPNLKYFSSGQTQKLKIGYIGTGAMGKQHIYKLLETGHKVQVYDKYPSAADPVISKGAKWTNSPAEAARNMDLVITNLPLPEHVLENMLGENGGVSGMHAKSTWMDFSTTDYHNTQHIAKVARTKGIYCLESPVSNLSHMGVDFCNASFYVSGDHPGYDISLNTLNTIGEISFFVHDEIGKAQTVKLLTNILFYTAVCTLSEMLMIVKKSNIDLLWFWDYLRASTAVCFAYEQVTPMVFDGSWDFSCSLEIAVKDTDLTVKLADELGVGLPLGRITEWRYRQAGQRFNPPDENHVKVVRLIEEDNHVNLQVEGFSAPSPYGRNRSYVHSPKRVIDKYGRKKPFPYRLTYDFPEPLPESRQNDIARTLVDFATVINYLILIEARQMGRNMGLSDGLIEDVIRWSCGTSWVFDQGADYTPNFDSVKKIKDYGFERSMRLPVLEKFYDYLDKPEDKSMKI